MSYLVSVNGGHAPSHIHPTIESAFKEAERLSKQPANLNRSIHVLKVVSTLKPVSTHQWEHKATANLDAGESS